MGQEVQHVESQVVGGESLPSGGQGLHFCEFYPSYFIFSIPLQDQILPYWIQCSNCHKFRKYETEDVPTPKFLAKFKCDLCEEEEDEVFSSIFLFY